MSDLSPDDPRNPLLIPPLIKETITAYVETGRPTGPFLQAVLTNNLFEAVAQADENSMKGLSAIVCYLHWKVPANCHGSPEVYNLWLRIHQLYRDNAPDSAITNNEELLMEAKRKETARRLR